MAYHPDAEIDHEAPEPPYRQLAGIITARIRRGDWALGRPIPSEARLVQEYGLARSTVRRAIALLVEEGRLTVVPQRGTYVRTSAKTPNRTGVSRPNGQPRPKSSKS